MAISKRLRFEVFKRDRFTCQYCGKRPPDTILHADHIIPKSKNGPDEIENLTTSCIACNQGKGDILLNDVAPALDEDQRLEALQEMAERRLILERQIVEADHHRKIQASVVAKAEEWVVDILGYSYVTSDQTKTLRSFTKTLTLDQIRTAMETTADGPATGSGGTWKYFCKCCWKMIKGEWGDDKGETDVAGDE